MRPLHSFVVAMLPLILGVGPASAFDRLPAPDRMPAIVYVADLDRHAHIDRHYRAGAYGYWRQRAAYARWMHNEYVRAGYPVRHRQFGTYARTYVCCHVYRRW